MKRRKFTAFLLAFILIFTMMLFSDNELVKAQELAPSSDLRSNEEVSSTVLKGEKFENSKEKEGLKEQENKGKEDASQAEGSSELNEAPVNEASEGKASDSPKDLLPSSDPADLDDESNDTSKESSEQKLPLDKDQEELKAESRELSTKIYLNGQSGDDNNDGQSPDKAVKTFSKAKEIATNNQAIKEIIVIGSTPIEGDISLQGTQAKVVRGIDYRDFLFTLSPGKVAKLSDIVIDGNSKNNNVKKSLINVDAAELYIQEGAILRNNNINFEESDFLQVTITQGGAIQAKNGSNIYMQGGSIEKNTSVWGGGIYLSHSDLDFSAGTIQDNHAKRFTYVFPDLDIDPYHYGAGGGICAYNGSSVKMSGEAKILNNYSDEIGGGISIGSNPWSHGSNSLLMQGGVIDGNTAESLGGGIYIQAEPQIEEYKVDKAIIKAGSITNNKALNTGNYSDPYAGGGIFIMGKSESWNDEEWRNGELVLYNTILRDNTSEKEGAAFAASTISDSRMYVTDGVAIYNNKSEKDASELFIERPDEGNPATYELSKRMLGGLPFAWKTPDEKLLPLAQYEEMPEARSLELHRDYTANKLADKLGKVIISGNYSGSGGGGIASNGKVTFGRDKDLTQLKVKKIWKKSKAPLGEKISVNLIANYEGKEYLIETRDLTEEDHWESTFKYLPKEFDGKEAVYSVKEVGENDQSVQINGSSYKVEVAGNMLEGFTITNTKQTNPDKADQSDKPDKANEPDNPNAANRPKTPNKVTPFVPSKGSYLTEEEANNPERFRVSNLPTASEEKTEEYQLRNKIAPKMIAQKEERNPSTGATLTFSLTPHLGIASFLYLISKKRNR